MRRSSSAGTIGGTFVRHGFASGIGRSSTAVEVSPQSDTEPAPADQVQALSKAKPASDQTSPAIPPAPLLRADAVLVAPAALRWTISDSGSLQRSLDGGKTWLDVNVVASNLLKSNLRLSPIGTTVNVQAEPTTQASTETNQTEAKSKAKLAAKYEENSTARSAAPPSAKSAEAEPTASPRTVFRALAVSSNAAEVWAGGSGGVLYHTQDGGNRWVRVVPSEAGIALTGDIIAIQFSDPRNGTVTTSNVEIWITADAGQTWHKQQ